MRAKDAQNFILKKVYRAIAGDAESALDFFITAEKLQTYLKSVATVEDGYARQFLQSFAPSQKTTIDFEDFCATIESVWERFLPSIAEFQPTLGALSGDERIDRALVDAALLVGTRTANPALHTFFQSNTLPTALETAFSPAELDDGYARFEQLCLESEEKLSAIRFSAYEIGLEPGSAFTDCLQSALLPLAIAREPCQMQRASAIALRLFERFAFFLPTSAALPSVYSDLGLLRALAAVAALLRFRANYESYALALAKAGSDKTALQTLFESAGRFACLRFEAGLALPGEDSLLYLLSLAELA